MTEGKDEFQEWFQSEKHEEMLKNASAFTLEKLRIRALGGDHDDMDHAGILHSLSDAMGTAYGLAAFYKALGLNRHAEVLFDDLKKFVRED